jgi:hypothetical protein
MSLLRKVLCTTVLRLLDKRFMNFSSLSCFLHVRKLHPLWKLVTNNLILSFRTYSYLRVFYKLRGVTVYEMGSAYTKVQIRKFQPSAVICQNKDTLN